MREEGRKNDPLASSQCIFILGRLLVGGKTSQVEAPVGVTKLPSSLKLGSQQPFSCVALEQLLDRPLWRDAELILMGGVDEQGHGVPRDLGFAWTGMSQWHDRVRESLDHSSSQDFHCLTNLDNHAVLGDVDLDDFSILGLTVKSHCWIRPADFIAVAIGVQRGRQAGEHPDVLVPSCPLPVESFLARVIVNQPTVHFRGESHSLFEEVDFERGQPMAKVLVQVLCEMLCRALHGEREVLDSSAQLRKLGVRPGILPEVAVLANERISKRVREE